MRTMTKLLIAIIAMFGFASALTGCSTTTPYAFIATATRDATTAINTISILGDSFGNPTAQAGQRITVTNQDQVDHTVTIASLGIDVTVPTQGSATFTAPAKPGNYALTCDFHHFMTGTLIVAK